MSYLTNSVTVQLPQFEGPLALLLYLIKKEEMDIMDIPIATITARYLEYIRMMKELDLEMAGEFIAMAATLIHVKSRMLLPTYDENGEVMDVEDPRKELVRRLLEYQKYQEAAKMLYDRPLLGRDVYARGIREKLDPKAEEIILEDNALYSLISAYRMAMKSIKKRVHMVAAKAQSIASRILEIKDRLFVGQKVALSELINEIENRRQQILITFLSALELGKIGMVSLFQTEIYGEIWLEAKKEITGEVISTVEEYDNLHSDEIAQNMLDKSNRTVAMEESMDFEEESAVPAVVVAEEIAVPQEELTEDMATDEEIAVEEAKLGEIDGI